MRIYEFIILTSFLNRGQLLDLEVAFEYFVPTLVEVLEEVAL